MLPTSADKSEKYEKEIIYIDNTNNTAIELVMDDEEPSEGGDWRAKQPGCTAVEPFAGVASL